MKTKVNVIDNKVKVTDFLSLRSVDLEGFITDILLSESEEKEDVLEDYKHCKVWVIFVDTVQPAIILHNDERNFIIYVKNFGYTSLDDGDMIFTDRVEAEEYLRKSGLKTFEIGVEKHKEIWNIILQTFDKLGQEEHYSITSFTTLEAAKKDYLKWREWDEQNPENKVERNKDGLLEHYYTSPDGKITRCKVMKSHVFNV